MQLNSFCDIKNIAQIISLENPKLEFLSSSDALKPVISIMPQNLKRILSTKECLCDIFIYNTKTVSSNRAKFRVRTSIAGYAQELRLKSNKKAIYDAIKLHLKYVPNDERIAALIKKDPTKPLNAANMLSDWEFAEWSLVINHSLSWANVLEARRRANLKRIKISRLNQPKGKFKITTSNQIHKLYCKAIKEAIAARYEKIAQIDEQRALLRAQRTSH